MAPALYWLTRYAHMWRPNSIGSQKAETPHHGLSVLESTVGGATSTRGKRMSSGSTGGVLKFVDVAGLYVHKSHLGTPFSP